MPSRDAVAFDRSDELGVPTLTVMIDDVAMRLALDTGSNVHVLDDTIALWAHLPDFTPDVSGTASEPYFLDAGGLATHYSVRGPVSLDVGVAALRMPTPIATLDLSTWREHGLAGLFSPQRVVPPASALEIDLPSRTMSLLAPSDAEAALAPREGWLPLSPVCATNDGVPLFAVHAEIAEQPVLLVVDTGAQGTFIDGRREAARALAGRTSTPGLRLGLGGVSDVRATPDVEVRLGDASVHIPVDVAEWTGSCAPVQGALGIDVLQHCQIILARDRGALRCPRGGR